MYTSRCYNGSNRSAVIACLILAAAIAHRNHVELVNEKEYRKFLRKAILGEIVIRGAAGVANLVQGNARATGTTSPLTITMGSTPTQGNLLIAAITDNSGNSSVNLSVSSIVQTGVTWHFINRAYNFGQESELWWGLIGSGASTSIAVTLSGNPSNLAVVNVCEWNGLTPTSPVDQTGSTTNTASPATVSASGATTQPIELVVVSAGTWNGSITAVSGGYTLLDGAGASNVAAGGYIYNVIASTGTPSTAYTYAGSQSNQVAVIATFIALQPTLPALVQGNARITGTTSPLTATMTSTPTQGNLLILTTTNNSGSSSTFLAVSSIVQTGVTWYFVNNGSNLGQVGEIWYAVIGSGASKSIAVTLSGTPSSGFVVNVCEWSGLVVSSPVDQTTSSTNQGQSGTTGTTTQAVELAVVCACDYSHSITVPGNGYTLLDGATWGSPADNAYLYRVLTSTGTQSTTWTGGSANAIGIIATFKASSIVSVSETVTGADSPVVPVVANATDSESGIGSEFAPILVTAPIAFEVGTYTETDVRTTGVLPYYATAVLEQGGFSEVFTIDVYIEVDVFESVAGTELLSTIGGPAINESGLGIDLPALSVTFTVADSGLGVEAWGVTASFTITETGSGAHGSSVSGGPGVNDAGIGTEKLTPGVTIPVTETPSGTDTLRSISAALKATDSGAFTEYVLVPWPVPIVSEIGLAIELAYTLQGQITVDGTSFSHVLTIQLDELVNMTNLPASDGLPNQVYQGGKGRKLTITGYTTDPVELAMILGLAQNSKHFFMLPTGECFYAYVASVPKPKKAEDGVIYNYSFVAQEAID